MTRDNGPANRQSDSHAIILCCIEAFEGPVRGLRLETDSHILHAQAHSMSLISINDSAITSRVASFRSTDSVARQFVAWVPSGESTRSQERASIVLWYCFCPDCEQPDLCYASSVDGPAGLTRVSASAEPSGVHGIANENVDPGPSLGVTQRRP
jgi:hypothetical protein